MQYVQCECLDRYEKNRICNFMPGHYPLLTTTQSKKHQILVKKRYKRSTLCPIYMDSFTEYEKYADLKDNKY